MSEQEHQWPDFSKMGLLELLKFYDSAPDEFWETGPDHAFWQALADKIEGPGLVSESMLENRLEKRLAGLRRDIESELVAPLRGRVTALEKRLGRILTALEGTEVTLSLRQFVEGRTE